MTKETSTKLFQNNQKLPLKKPNAAKPIIYLTKQTKVSANKPSTQNKVLGSEIYRLFLIFLIKQIEIVECIYFRLIVSVLFYTIGP